jgi:hypothetical protein
VAFAVGWFTGTHRRLVEAALIGAQADAVGLIVATVYYSTDLVFGIDADRRTVSYWPIRALVFGLPLGAAGVVARRLGPIGLLAALTIPVGGAANMVVFPLRTGLPGERSAAGSARLTVWLAAATTAALVILRFLRTWRMRRHAKRAGDHVHDWCFQPIGTHECHLIRDPSSAVKPS